MNKDQVLGPLREIAFAAGVALVTFGVTSQATVELVSGVLLHAGEGPFGNLIIEGDNFAALRVGYSGQKWLTTKIGSNRRWH